MTAVGREMSEGDRGGGEGVVGRSSASALLLTEHAGVMGRVAMALVGDAARAERVLEHAAREAGAGAPPAGVASLAWLLGLVRAASATQLSRLPLKTRPGGYDAAPTTERLGAADAAPTTERLGAGDAAPARAALAGLKPTEREAVVLCLVGGLEAADVAAACGVDLGTAKTRIARGVEQLLQEVAPGDEEGGPR
ncbi:MAG: hypothetical protein KF894_05185 [Labilithrix sp.]|nr:hypothetical protein [Labilithrix sp.]